MTTCIITGADGENPDDCTTHDHEKEEIWPVPVMADMPSHSLPLSSCCSEPLEVQREVTDTVTYSPEGYNPETKTLTVRYLKVYEGDAGSFSVECTHCHHEVECEVEEL